MKDTVAALIFLILATTTSYGEIIKCDGILEKNSDWKLKDQCREHRISRAEGGPLPSDNRSEPLRTSPGPENPPENPPDNLSSPQEILKPSYQQPVSNPSSDFPNRAGLSLFDGTLSRFLEGFDAISTGFQRANGPQEASPGIIGAIYPRYLPEVLLRRENILQRFGRSRLAGIVGAPGLVPPIAP